MNGSTDKEKSTDEAAVNFDEEEVCVKCGVGLGYTKGRDIAFRPFYVEGAGDLCPRCSASLF